MLRGRAGVGGRHALELLERVVVLENLANVLGALRADSVFRNAARGTQGWWRSVVRAQADALTHRPKASASTQDAAWAHGRGRAAST